MLRFRSSWIFFLSVFALVAFSSPSDSFSADLIKASSTQINTEIDGLGAPDSKFALSGVAASEQQEVVIADLFDIGDQGKGQIVERSSGCSSGCSTGCSTGCSIGCSTGCSSGCSSGCSTGCRY